MSNRPTVARVVDVRDRLISAVADCAARERNLVGQFNLRTGAEEKKLDHAVREEQSAVASAVATRDALFAERGAELAERCEKRERWILQAAASAHKRHHEWYAGAEGRRKNRIQIALMHAKRVCDAELASERDAYASRGESLREAAEEFTELERASRRTFLAYAGGIRLSRENTRPDEHTATVDFDASLNAARQRMQSIRAELRGFRELRLPMISRYFSLWLGGALLLSSLPVAALALHGGWRVPRSLTAAAWYAAAAGLAVCAVHLSGRRRARPIGRRIGRHFEAVRVSLRECGRALTPLHKQRMADIEDTYEKTVSNLEQGWDKPSPEETPWLRDRGERKLRAKADRLTQKHRRACHQRREALEKAYRDDVAGLRGKSEARVDALRTAYAAHRERVAREIEAQWKELDGEWQRTVVPLYREVVSINADADALFPAWTSDRWNDWRPPTAFADAVEFARLDVELTSLSHGVPGEPRLALPGPFTFQLPVCLTFPEHGSLLFETHMACRDCATGALNNLMLRLLSVSPPGKVAFTIFDPVELGQNFAGIMHLADFEESIVTHRIWTQPRQIEDRLADLNEHMEKVIQMYLRNEYETIADYNRQAGDIAEKYHFLVVADFPANFSDLAARRLLSIAASGARCGVFVLLHWDRRRPAPQDFVSEELRKSMVCLGGSDRGFFLVGRESRGAEVVPDAPPEPERATAFLKEVGRRSIDSNRIEVPFSQVAPPAADFWSMDTSEELRVAVGRTGATKLQYLALGKGTRQHVLIAGKTGSGKSTLFHVIVSNLALWCSPEQVEFYLVDFKKGVEFKCYATRQLPHARVVAIESDREFGLSVLERVDEELKRRGDLFRNLGVQDLAGYKKGGGTSLPRTLLMVDEFQEFFVEDDEISRASSLLLDRIVRQGRAFGIHVLLGSQTLGGAYTLARATLGQMTIRIALQCNESDAYLIMDDDNPAPRLLSRPGEAIYNDAAGRMEGNSPFQVVWLADEERDRHLDAVRELADRADPSRPGPVVFEGNAPANVASNKALRGLLAETPIDAPAVARVWLGEPNRIKGPTEAVFARQSGSNLLVVGQHEELAFATLVVALISLSAQYPPGKLRLVVLDGSPADSMRHQALARARDAIPHALALAGQGDIPDVLQSLTSELMRRESNAGDADGVTTFLLIDGIQKYKTLRFEEDFGFSTAPEPAAAAPGAQLNDLIGKGSSLGIHLLITCDTYGNAVRSLSRKAVGEFGMRVLFQMSPNDSASLIETPAASRLGLHRALFHNVQQGYTELYRPYALPPDAWFTDVSHLLSRRLRPESQRLPHEGPDRLGHGND